jgi:hypothetical protein
MTQPITTATVPEIWFKAKRVLRTIVQAVLTFLGLWATIAIVAPQVLAELAKILPGSWIAWLTGALAFVGVVAGVLARIMAIPQINAFLVKIGLGSVPAAAVIDARVTNDVSSLPRGD